jgi:polysaccharide biosynthesis transport protein
MLMRSSESYSTLDDPADEIPIIREQRTEARSDGALLDLRGMWLLLRWRARLIGLVALATVVLAGCALVALPPKYRATTVVLVDPRQPNVTNTQAVLTGIGADTAAVESQVELIESSALARKVIASLKLAEDPDFVSPSLIEQITGGLLALVGRDPTASEQRISRLVHKFQSGLVVRRRGLTYVLEIGYVAKTPAKAAHISAAVAEAYLDDQRAAKGEITARASGWLVDRIEEMRERVRKSEEAVADYRSANNMVDVTQGNKLINRQVEDLTQQLALTRSRTAEARARLERVQQATQRNNDPAALSEALQSQVIANLRSQYAEATRAEAESSAINGDRHPGLIAVRAQLAGLRRQIDTEVGRILVAVRNDYQAATTREAGLENELAKLKEQAGSLSQADVRLRELDREAQANRALFEQFLTRAKETTEQQSLQIADARIVSPALPPLKPDRPSAILLLVAAAVGGGILGIGLVLLLEQMRQGFRTSREVAQFLSLSNIGMLPRQTDDHSRRRRRFGAARAAPAATAGSGAARFALDHPHSLYARNLRAIHSRLRRSGPRVGDVVVIVSALPGEGKSTFACNFALAAAGAGVRTLLIDGDLFAASSTRAFGIQKAGVLEILDGKASFWNVIAKETKTGLHVLGARDLSAAADAAVDLDRTRLAAFLREFRKHFDLVVLDSPAILPIGGSPAHLECADRAVLLVEWDRTERQAVAEALDMLDAHAQKVAGVVLNKVSTDWCRLFDYGGYLINAASAKGAS